MADRHPIVSAIDALTKPGRDEHAKRVERFDQAYNVYRGRPDRNVVVERGDWHSKLRVKYGMQVLDTELVNIVSGRPKVRVRPLGPEHELPAKAMQKLLNYFIEEDHFVEKQPQFVQQGLIFGVTGAKNHWLYQTSERKVRRPTPNPLVPGSNMLLAGVEEVVDRDGPTFEPWDMYDMWWDPDARDVDSARYVALRSWLSKDQILRLQWNEDRQRGIFHNVDELFAAGSKTAEERAQTRGNDAKRKDKFEIVEYWVETPAGLRLIVVGNDMIVLRDEPTPYWHGKKPVVVTQPRPDLFDMEGIADTELVDHLQQALWTIQNMRMDNLHLTVARGITYREGGVTDPNALEIRPRFKWPVMDHDDVRPFEMLPLPAEAYNEEQGLLERLQYVTGVNPYISGADTSSIDQNTATGITALQEVASRLLRFKAAQIQNKGYQRTYEQWGEMIQQLLDRDVAVRIEGQGNEYTWENVTPEDIIGNYQYQVEGSEESLSRQQERGEAVALLNAFAPLAQLGTINLQPILEKVAQAYDFPNPQALVAPPMAPPSAFPQQAAQNPGLPMGGQQGGQVDPRILQAISGGGR